MQQTLSPLLPNWLTRCSENLPTHLAVQCGQIHWSFAELARQTEKLAAQLATAGVSEKSRVALLAPNGLSYIVFVHALTRLGAILVPLNTRLTAEELCWQLNDVRAELLVSSTDLAESASTIGSTLPELPRAILHINLSTQENAHIQLLTQTAKAYLPTEIAPRPLIDLDATQVIMYTSGTTGKPKGVLITYGMQWWNASSSALRSRT